MNSDRLFHSSDIPISRIRVSPAHVSDNKQVEERDNFYWFLIQKHICTTIRLISKDLEFSCVFFDLCKELVGECLPTRRPTQKLIIPGSTVISFQMIFEALQLRFKFKNTKNPGIQPTHSTWLIISSRNFTDSRYPYFRLQVIDYIL